MGLTKAGKKLLRRAAVLVILSRKLRKKASKMKLKKAIRKAVRKRRK